ncbi:hypothetical protein EP331_07245 [bacterium]|nr:MAG: hypothetical protein EP331_07245 [bacterium]
MMKFLFLILMSTASLIPFKSWAQESAEEPYKIVFQLVSADSTVHKSFLKQLKNILAADPRTDIKVVCHGPGIQLIMKSKSTQLDKIREFSKKGVEFVACENTMKGRGIPKEDILEIATYAEAGILHIVKLQREGYAYIKAGY